MILRYRSSQPSDRYEPCLFVIEELEHLSEFFIWLLAGDCCGEEIHEFLKVYPAGTFLVKIADHLIERISHRFGALLLDSRFDF